MREYRISNPATNENYTVTEIGDFEYLNPVEQFRQMFTQSQTSLYRRVINSLPRSYPQDIVQEFLERKADEYWQDQYAKITRTELPDNLSKIFVASSKKEQIKALKNMSLTGLQLRAFIISAWENFGYAYSQYIAKHHHNGLDENQLPILVHLDGDNVSTIGEPLQKAN